MLMVLAGLIRSCSPQVEERLMQQTPSNPICSTLVPDENLEAAWEWARSTAPRTTGMIIYQNGVLCLERYELANACPGGLLAFLCRFGPIRWLLLDVLGGSVYGGSPTRTFSLFSMTKSLAGIAAVLLEEQGVISLDATVATYIPEWLNADNRKSSITVRELLSLSSGIDATSRRARDITLADGLNAPLLDGETRFDYGAEPFTVFSQVIKAATGGQDAQAFLDEHLFTPLGISVSMARTNDDVNIPVLSTAGMAPLQDLATLGLELLAAVNGNGQVLQEQAIASLTTPGVNPSYGLTFWLNAEGVDLDGSSLQPPFSQCGNTAAFYMIGGGGQILTVVPDHAFVMVKSAILGVSTQQQRQGMWDALFRDLQCQCD